MYFTYKHAKARSWKQVDRAHIEILEMLGGSSDFEDLFTKTESAAMETRGWSNRMKLEVGEEKAKTVLHDGLGRR